MLSSKFKLLTVILIFAVIAVIWFSLLKSKPLSDKGELELIQAPIWADLQAIEFQHRSVKNLRVPVLLKGAVASGKYDVLGVSSENTRFPFVWILLNANAGANGIYAIPQNAGFVLSCGYLRKLESKEQIDSKVYRVLQSHCVVSATH